MMTPDKAQELLDGTVPGPWLCERDSDEYEFLIGTEDFGIITEVGRESNGRLIAAAPGMAEQIANMHYEYAVQVNDHHWVRENDEGQFTLTIDSMRALRHCHPRIAAKIAKAASAHFSCDCRVVRRLVSPVEVVE